MKYQMFAREWAFAALDATRPYTVLVVAAVDERDVSASTSDGYRGAFVLDNTFLRDADKANIWSCVPHLGR